MNHLLDDMNLRKRAAAHIMEGKPTIYGVVLYSFDNDIADGQECVGFFGCRRIERPAPPKRPRWWKRLYHRWIGRHRRIAYTLGELDTLAPGEFHFDGSVFTARTPDSSRYELPDITGWKY